MNPSEALKRTPLYTTHLECGGKVIPFAGWEMPVQYSGILDEHTAVRERVGLFDISHMGEVLVSGPGAEAGLNHLLTNDIRKAVVGQAQYTLMCTPSGGVVDDLIVYRLEPNKFLLIINASHIEKDFNWIRSHMPVDVALENQSEQTAGLALQGPAAVKLIPAAADLPVFHVRKLNVCGVDCLVARTGYTGEDGFELICDAKAAAGLWKELLKRGAEFGIRPCGLGCRDTLRLEMCYPLHGSDITEATTPIEAGLGRFVSFDKGNFIGRSVMLEQKEKGTARKLVAFKMSDKSPPPRPHYPIMADGRKVGEIASGTQSPTLGIGIGMGYVETAAAGVGSKIDIEIRGKNYPAVVEKKPLLKRNK